MPYKGAGPLFITMAIGSSNEILSFLGGVPQYCDGDSKRGARELTLMFLNNAPQKNGRGQAAERNAAILRRKP
jgi:hypothetical protein